jgi:putative tricarboxylic transport membrane protein
MESNPIDGINLTIANRFKMLFSLTEIKSVLRGSILGGFIGILPGASYALSSSICDRIEKKFNDSGLARLLAAESANNSAAITVLIPLLFLAIPIVYSESILLGIAEGMGFGITTSVSFLTDNIKPILLTLFVSNVILWIIAGSLYRAVITLYNYTQKYLYQGMLLSAVIMVTWLGYLGNQLLLSLSVFVICVLAGWKITANDSKLVLVFAFFIADSAIDELYRFYLLNF